MKIHYFALIFCLSILSATAQTAQTITFPDIPVKGYGDATFTLSATSSSGLPVTYVSSNTAVATISGTTVTIKTTGFSFISAYQVGNGTYAAATPVAQLLVVCPKSALTVKAADKTVDFGVSPVFTYTISGFKKSETTSVVSGSPVFDAVASNLAGGTYPIVINRGTLAATNYEFEMIDGVLTVKPDTATPVILHEESIEKIYPNPARDIVNISNCANSSFVILNLSGKMLASGVCNGNLSKLDVSNFPSGTYVLKINKKQTVILRKLFIR